MLRLTVSPEEYLMINDNIKIVFLGGTKNHLRIMIDAPKEVNIVRSTVLENQITDPEERAKLPKYYAEEEHPEKYRKKSNVIEVKCDHHKGKCGQIISYGNNRRKSGSVRARQGSSYSGYYKTNNKYLGEKDFSITIQIRTLPQKELGSNTRR